ncbi:MAG: glycosyltransferase [Alphaproteobacteria bacterium]|nr:glycosyltransferase [Alphaproteobacteria bacterium]
MVERNRIAVIVPCYRVSGQVLDVLAAIPDSVEGVFCVDDACPEGSGRLIEQTTRDPRVLVLFHTTNQGVGAAVKTGYRAARAAGFTIAVKLDGDGQMDPALISRFVAPIIAEQADYTKGNRFFFPDDWRDMPGLRLFGNAILSFLAKLSTGYWNQFDPTNGYTALQLRVLDLMRLDKVADRYFFETDLLFRLYIARCVVRDIPMTAQYKGQPSSLKVRSIILPFVAGNTRNFFKRIFYSYFLRDFQVASIEFVLGPVLLLMGLIFGGYHWWLSFASEVTATPGTVMIAALLIILGVQFTLSALHFDLRNVPTVPVHPLLITQCLDQGLKLDLNKPDRR